MWPMCNRNQCTAVFILDSAISAASQVCKMVDIWQRAPGRLGAGGEGRKSSCFHNLAKNWPVLTFTNVVLIFYLLMLDSGSHHQIWTSQLPLGRRLPAQQGRRYAFQMTQVQLSIRAPWYFRYVLYQQQEKERQQKQQQQQQQQQQKQQQDVPKISLR